MSLQENFLNATKEVANFRTVNDEALFATFYSLYKQATAGDCTATAPSGSDSLSKAKFEAWAKLKGTSKDAAMEAYVKKYEEKKGDYKK